MGIQITHHVTCAMPKCDSIHEESYKHVPGNAPVWPVLPPGWSQLLSGWICEKHEIWVDNKLMVKAQPNVIIERG